MIYSLLYSKEALKQLKKLDNEAKKRILSTLERIRVRPYPHVKRLTGNPYYRLRVGDYRVILDIINDQIVIFVIEVKHRKNVYK